MSTFDNSVVFLHEIGGYQLRFFFYMLLNKWLIEDELTWKLSKQLISKKQANDVI